MDKQTQLKYYQQMPCEQLLNIKPYWAAGKAADKILNDSLSVADGIYSVYSVDPRELISNTEFGEVKTDRLFNGNSLNDVRVAGILHRWDNEKFVDPPIVVIPDMVQTKLVFVDGRHRTKVALLLGHNKMPVALLNSEVSKISQMIGLEKY